MLPMSHSAEPAERDPLRLTRRRFDILIIGGGINGAGIARDLALRGLSVALVDKGDFACGASSASTKLIHGGLRYLERGDLRLVYESTRERHILQQIAPHLVHPLPILIPAYRQDPRHLRTIHAGMLLYDLLALGRNTHRHQMLAAAEATACCPLLQPDNLTGAARYWDCSMDDARLCLENILAARTAGAEVVNYLQVVGLLKRGGQLSGVQLQDQETGACLEAEARVIINASGPWLDRICALDGEESGKLRPSRGSHLLLPRLPGQQEALYLVAREDRRLFFVIPWGALSLVGTTDIDHPGDADTVSASEEEIAYLLTETGRHLRIAPPRRQEVIASFAGLRPLLAASGTVHTVSREHRIFNSTSGLISVGGGKYTTYRAVAAQVARLACARLGRGTGRSTTDRLALPGGETGPFATFAGAMEQKLLCEFEIPAHQAAVLIRRYGSRLPALLATVRRQPSLLRPVVPGSPLLEAELVWAADHELARTPEDILRRRTPLSLQAGRGLVELPAVAARLASHLQKPQCLSKWQADYLKQHGEERTADGASPQTRIRP
jgi:glycerol-3-phosphate dehydrogenase